MKTVPGYKFQVSSRKITEKKYKTLCSLLFALCSFIFVGCATTPDLPPHPPKYIYKEEKAMKPSVNSLWRDSASLYEDGKARRLNDLVTIKVMENITGVGKADTDTSRDSSIDTGIENLFGLTPEIKGVDFFGKSKVFTPGIKSSMKNEFKGSGETSREGKLIGTITAKVVEVMPNGNLVLESRKDITINKEKQILVLRGMVRPDDVAVDNTISSDKVADAEVFYVGDGIVQDKQSPGWLTRVVDNVWPF